MYLKIQTVNDTAFSKYGRVVENLDTKELLNVLESTTDAPENAVNYVPSDKNLEAVPIMQILKENVYGGMPIQIGYCNGTNTKLNCLEYHKDSEIDIPADDIILLVAKQQDSAGRPLDTANVEAFLCPKGVAVELYATTLHYAPCSAKKHASFRVVIVLPRGTNLEKPNIVVKNEEDKRLFACNKWLLAHPESSEASKGAYIGLTGENLDIYELLNK